MVSGCGLCLCLCLCLCLRYFPVGHGRGCGGGGLCGLWLWLCLCLRYFPGGVWRLRLHLRLRLRLPGEEGREGGGGEGGRVLERKVRVLEREVAGEQARKQLRGSDNTQTLPDNRSSKNDYIYTFCQLPLTLLVSAPGSALGGSNGMKRHGREERALHQELQVASVRSS